ncbi:MAG TPA: DnaJ domain-containing protein [Marmoricola sp.]|nr:DnaJ domain-containing protein [Marmoricola sp.]
MASVTWYDLLGVERDATPDQIRVAWREATDRAEPGTSQFKKYNEAAEVLLDARARSAYDAELATEPDLEPDLEPAAGHEPAVEPTATTDTTSDTTTDTTSGVPRWAAPLASTGVTIAVALATVLAVAVGGYFWFQNHRHDEQVDAGQEASAAAERALPFVLSYDYRQLPADKARAVRYLSPKYQKEYTATFDKLIASTDGRPGPAKQTSAVVKATVRSVGVVDSESDVAKVIVFIDQATTKNGGTPKFSLNRLTVSMVRSGNSWLVDNINSY